MVKARRSDGINTLCDHVAASRQNGNPMAQLQSQVQGCIGHDGRASSVVITLHVLNWKVVGQKKVETSLDNLIHSMTSSARAMSVGGT